MRKFGLCKSTQKVSQTIRLNLTFVKTSFFRLCNAKLAYCSKCRCRYRKTSTAHKCGLKFCTHCKNYYNSSDILGEHNCAMTEPSEQKNFFRMIPFDIETRQLSCGTHHVRFVLKKKYCSVLLLTSALFTACGSGCFVRDKSRTIF